MRSAIYYPRTEVHSESLMRSSLLLWDKLYTIVPESGYQPNYGPRSNMASAWNLIGNKIVPDSFQQKIAHDAISHYLESGIPPTLEYTGDVDRPNDTYEIWPQKFAAETWDLLRRNRLTGDLLEDGDYPFTEAGGLLVMSKLADACAGSTFARVTDRLLAYGLIADSNTRSDTETSVVPITLDLIDANAIPIETLISFRKRELRERRGADYTEMRHNYADAVQKQIDLIKQTKSLLERTELSRQFSADMARDLKDLRDVLKLGKFDLLLRPVIVATVVTAGSMIVSGLHSPQMLAIAGGAALSTSLVDTAKHVTELFSSGLSYNTKQKEAMSKHPMAYMYALSQHR